MIKMRSDQVTRHDEESHRVNESVSCKTFPCAGAQHANYLLPNIEVAPERVSILLISESAPADSTDHYYAAGNPCFARPPCRRSGCGAAVTGIRDILDLGVY